MGFGFREGSFFFLDRRKEEMSCRGVEARMSEWTRLSDKLFVDTGMREECVKYVARVNGSFECCDSTFPIPIASYILRLFSRLRVVFYIACMFSTHCFFIFFKWKMKIGWHFIWHLSDSRDVLETSKTIFGRWGSTE